MNAKERFYSGVARETIHRLTSNTDNWTAFLRTMGRNYEFSYPEQVMIHAQRPDATLCKEYEEWNSEEYRRYIRRGSKGIALFVTDSNKPYLRYVFDISDTGIRRSSPTLNIWGVTEAYRPMLQNAIASIFEVEAKGSVEMQLGRVAEKLTDEYWEEYGEQFFDIVENSFLEEYDRDNLRMAFKRAVATSVEYALYVRCVTNPDEYFEQEDFKNVFDFNTRQTTNALGTAVNSITFQICKEIEQVIEEYEQNKEMERSTYYERNDLYEDRRLSDSKYAVESDRREGTGQIRENEESISEESQADGLQRHDSGRNLVPTSLGDSGNSNSQKRTDDDGIAETKSSTGQKDHADGMGTSHEHVGSTGGRNNSDGAYQQLSFELFPSENEQISFIDSLAESQEPSAFSFDQSVIDHMLLLGSNTDASRKRIATEFMKQKPIEEMADFLKTIYHGGFGIKEEKGDISAWYTDEGIRLAKGNSAQRTERVQIVSWREAAERIGQLLEEGRFATNVELAEAPSYERQKIAETIWYLYHDLSYDARDQGFLSVMKEVRGGGFSDVNIGLANLLQEKEFRTRLTEEYRHFLVEWKRDASLLRFQYHQPEQLLLRLQELELPRREYVTDMSEIPQYEYFITDDELNAALVKGSGFSGGKRRIYEYYQHPHTLKEKADFLKEQYGTGGRSHALSGSTGSDEWYDAKGDVFKKTGCRNVKLSWTQMATRIGDLINHDRYLTPEEKAKLQANKDVQTMDEDEVQETVSEQEVPEDKPAFEWQVGETVYLEGTAFDITEIGEHDIQMLDPTLVYPVYRVESRENFERLVREDERNLNRQEERKEIPAVNFQITDEHLGEGGPKQKFSRNVEAIRLLFKLEGEDRNATSEEQEILSQYVGWGGLADAFDKNKTAWTSEYTELKELLPEREYEMARASTLNAHYTSPVVIGAMYDAMQQMGFTSGNILEPAMGVGNFFGMLPEEMRNSRLYGVELDAISGRIAKKLYPNANITIAGFESTDRRDFFDLAIGNVPFGNYRVSDKPYDKLGFSIHNYFFAKALDQVRPGGVVAFVTSRYTLDQQSPDVRKYLAQKAELLGAIRLPNNAFRANAGTDVVSDIIFLQKREHPIDIEPDWVHLGMTEEGYVLNSYFIRHPEMILGELTMQTTQYGKEECTVIPKDGLELSKLLQEAITHIHGKYEEVLNLLDNGRKAMDGKGVLEVIGKVEDQGYALYVRDSGKGMPKEEIPRITEAFYMIDKSRARSQGGAGLGLSLCMEIVKRHGGTLEFQSEEGVGTTARIFLPEEGENK